MEKQIIQFRVKQVYGKDMMYLVDEEQALTLAKLTGRKTMSESDVRALERFGFAFVQVI